MYFLQCGGFYHAPESLFRKRTSVDDVQDTFVFLQPNPVFGFRIAVLL